VLRRFLLAALLFVSPSAWAQGSESVTLSVGEQRVIRVGDVDRTSVEKPSVASARPEGTDGIRIKGSSPGTTQLKVWSGKSLKTITVTVK
jgi:hypothetical protein